MPVPRGMAERRAAEAMIEGADGCDGLLTVLCHRRHLDPCRRAVLLRADILMAKRRKVPHA